MANQLVLSDTFGIRHYIGCSTKGRSTSKDQEIVWSSTISSPTWQSACVTAVFRLILVRRADRGHWKWSISREELFPLVGRHVLRILLSLIFRLLFASECQFFRWLDRGSSFAQKHPTNILVHVASARRSPEYSWYVHHLVLYFRSTRSDSPCYFDESTYETERDLRECTVDSLLPESQIVGIDVAFFR